MDILNTHDLKIMNEIIRSGKDVVIRQSPHGISILAQKTDLRKRKETPKKDE